MLFTYTQVQGVRAAAEVADKYILQPIIKAGNNMYLPISRCELKRKVLYLSYVVNRMRLGNLLKINTQPQAHTH